MKTKSDRSRWLMEVSAFTKGAIRFSQHQEIILGLVLEEALKQWPGKRTAPMLWARFLRGLIRQAVLEQAKLGEITYRGDLRRGFASTVVALL